MGTPRGVAVAPPVLARRELEPAASFATHARSRGRTFYVGPEEPANASAFTECFLGKSGEVVPELFRFE